MRSRALRIAVAILFAGALAGAAYIAWTQDAEAAAASISIHQFDQRAAAVSRALLDIKGAQAGYVAAGQGEDFWTAKVDALLGTVRDGLAGLRAQGAGSAAQVEIEAAAAAIEDFEEMDRRAREYARGGQRLLASDLIFSDGIEKMNAASEALARARAAERQAAATRLQRARRQLWLVGAGVGALGVLVLVLLVPLPQEDAPAARVIPSEPEPAALQPVSLAPAPVPPPVVTAPAPAPEAPAQPPDPPSIDLAAIASVCSELARVADTRGLPAALERAAGLLHASGIVVWIADPDGRELIPVVTWGYPAGLVARLGAIQRDAENVTAAAFRTGVLQILKSDEASPGAIATPLLTPAGPVGVMAAEVLDARERDEQTLAAAAIVAAQLSTLMVPPTRAPGRTEAAGA